MHEVRVRPARTDERQLLEDLQRRASLVSPGLPADLRADPSQIQLPSEHIAHATVAERDGMILGFCVLLGRSEAEAELDGLFVDPPYWRQGIARRLMREAERLAVSQGHQSIYVVANPDALEFYAACCFVDSGEAATRFGPAPALRLFLPLKGGG